MTLQEIKRLTAFNAWATNKIFDSVASLTAEEATRDLKTSHKSIHGTLAHLTWAEKLWLSRLTGSPEAPRITADQYPTTADLKKAWEETGLATAKFLGTLSDKKLQETFTMTVSTGQRYTHTIGDALQHLVDHSSYHRGQVVAMMRQLDRVPAATGMIRFLRETQGAR